MGTKKKASEGEDNRYEKTYKRKQDRSSAIRKLKDNGFTAFQEEDREDGFYLLATKEETVKKAPSAKKKTSKKSSSAEKPSKSGKKKTSKKKKDAEETKKKGKKKKKKSAQPAAREPYQDWKNYWNLDEAGQAVSPDGEEVIDLSEGDYRMTMNGVLTQVKKDHGDGTGRVRYLWAGQRPAMPLASLCSIPHWKQIQEDREELEAKKFKAGDIVICQHVSGKKKKVLRSYRDCVLLSGSDGGWFFSGACSKPKGKKKKSGDPTKAAKKASKAASKKKKKTSKKKTKEEA